jgi:hypothetical protein
VINGCAGIGVTRVSEPDRGMSAEVLARYNEGAAYYQSKDFNKALASYRSAFDLAQTRGDQAAAGFGLSGMGASQQGLES